ncbi:hypothetical protein C8250_016820 [Streptomyces sp. So13.3]|uniref:hypothetical protein n=1 Tax=Streptomyces sp. So13.3 TaxID=2136173 RepID=UPI001106346F|nr:hypothetical protein [Streptomyces sp. So13.3]QNA73363.1 hypothetical protein C8250_016820 [Streptomyces sp. So13.3]
MNDDTWNVGIECPEDWIPLPLEPGIDLGAWALEQAGKLAAAPAEVDADALMYDLRERAADSRGREPVFAFGLYPEGFEEALAVLEVDVVHPDDKVPSITLDWITEVFATGDFQEPEVERAVLPAGPAVRIRQGLAGRGTGQSGALPDGDGHLRRAAARDRERGHGPRLLDGARPRRPDDGGGRPDRPHPQDHGDVRV